jgi:hypothetical protein
MESSFLFFYQTYNFTWSSCAATYSIENTPLEYMDMYIFQDITDGENRGYDLNLQWRNNKTLYWGDEDGPSRATTVRCTYVGNAEWLDADGDQPSLIMPSHRDLLALSAAVLLRKIADEQAPGSWMQELNERRLAWWKAMQARPRDNIAQVRSLTMTDGLDFNRFNNDPFYS